MPRLAVIRFAHEGNSFNPIVTDRAAFERAEWLKGEAARETYAGTRTEMGAVCAFVDARPDWQVMFLRCAAAGPGGPVADDVVTTVLEETAEALPRLGPWDAVYVSLHGAMLAETMDEPEVELLSTVRAAVGPGVPVAATFDLHANLSRATSALADIMIGYKTYPHVDVYETGEKALDLLVRTQAGEIRPRSRIAMADCVLPSHNMRTESDPMAMVEALAAELVAEYGFHDLTPFGGFAYGDVPSAGASASVCFEPSQERAARHSVLAVASVFHDRRNAFVPHLSTPEDAIAAAFATPANGPVALIEPADNPMSGGIGDTPGLFAALMAARPPGPTVFAFFRDPVLVERAREAGEGAALEVALGARLTARYGPPVAIHATVEALTGGRFVNDGPMWRGLITDLGPTAVLRVDGVADLRVIVTAACVSPNDPAYFHLHGIEPTETALLCVKAKNHFRAAFGNLCARIVEVDTPGPATADVGSLPFVRVPAERLPAPLR